MHRNSGEQPGRVIGEIAELTIECARVIAGCPVLFEQPLCEGWVHPCTLIDIQHRLKQLPSEDTIGLHAIGLIASTYGERYVDGRYFFTPVPTIHLYSYPATLMMKMPPHVKRKHIELYSRDALSYGMEIEQTGSRWIARWSAASLRRFNLDHVLAHEIGHHVYYSRRHAQGLACNPNTNESEQFAEAYAVRHASG